MGHNIWDFLTFLMRGNVNKIWTQDYLLCYHDKLLFFLSLKGLRHDECDHLTS